MNARSRSALRPGPLATALLSLVFFPVGTLPQAQPPALPTSSEGSSWTGATAGGGGSDCGFGGGMNTWGERLIHHTVVGGDGNVFELGSYQGSVDFDPDPVVAEWRANTTTQCDPELYLASYTGAGALRFVHVFPATGADCLGGRGVRVNAVVADADGVSFTGSFLGNVDFDPDPDATVLLMYTPDGPNAYVASFTNDGDLRFARNIGGAPYGDGYDITVDGAGHLFATGYREDCFLELIYVESYAADGGVRFTYAFGDSYPDPSGGRGRTVTTDGQGNVYVRGTFFGTVDFHPAPDTTAYLTSTSHGNHFLASYTNAGAFRFASTNNGGHQEATAAGAAPLAVADRAAAVGDGAAARPPSCAAVRFPSCADVAGALTAAVFRLEGATGEAGGELAAGVRALPAAAGQTPPSPLALRAPHPNPSIGSATLPFEVTEPAVARLSVYDGWGREVVRLVDGPVEAGRHEVRLEASALPSGVYVVRLTGGSGPAHAQRLTVVR